MQNRFRWPKFLSPLLKLIIYRSLNHDLLDADQLKSIDGIIGKCSTLQMSCFYFFGTKFSTFSDEPNRNYSITEKDGKFYFHGDQTGIHNMCSFTLQVTNLVYNTSTFLIFQEIAWASYGLGKASMSSYVALVFDGIQPCSGWLIATSCSWQVLSFPFRY